MQILWIVGLKANEKIRTLNCADPDSQMIKEESYAGSRNRRKSLYCLGSVNYETTPESPEAESKQQRSSEANFSCKLSSLGSGAANRVPVGCRPGSVTNWVGLGRTYASRAALTLTLTLSSPSAPFRRLSGVLLLSLPPSLLPLFPSTYHLSSHPGQDA